MKLPRAFRDHLRKIGSIGGSRRSRKQKAASLANLAKAKPDASIVKKHNEHNNKI
jgi:hypothetical protein